MGCLLLSGFSVDAQHNDVDLFVTDMLKIADDYASSAAERAAHKASAGWFSTAESLELWEIDLSVHANVLLVPEHKRNNNISSSDYTTFGIRGAKIAVVPTTYGETTEVYFEGDLEILGENIPFEFMALV